MAGSFSAGLYPVREQILFSHLYAQIIVYFGMCTLLSGGGHTLEDG